MFFTMKNFTNVLLIVFCLALSNLSYARIIRVNNNPGVDADFTTLQDAVDNAGEGDTVHVEASLTSYGSATINKRLIILGSGYFLKDNFPLQSNLLPSPVSNLVFRAGSDGSVMQGMTLESNLNIDAGTSNIIIRRNNLQTFVDINGDNHLITGNFINSFILIQGFNTIITRNIIGRSIDSNNNAAGTIIENNTFISTLFEQVIDVFNASIQNNIVLSQSSSAIDDNGNSNLIRFNVVVGGIMGLGNENNQTGVELSTLFVGGDSPDAQYQLAPGSPAIGAGFAGVDAGVFVANDPYILSGIPPIPTITDLNLPATGTTTGGIRVTIRANSRQ